MTIIPYVSRTGSQRTLSRLAEHGWRLLVNAYGVHRHEGFGYAIDNGAWSAHQKGEPWDEQRFVALVEALGVGADWIVAPDIVEGGLTSLARSERWLPWVSGFSMPLIAVQDGMESADVWPLVGPRCGLFLGGSTEWKLSTLPAWARMARQRGCYLHVGRVNSQKRINLCSSHGVDSFDGTCALYEKHVPMLTAGVNQLTLGTERVDDDAA